MGFTFTAEMKGVPLLMGDEAIFDGAADLRIAAPQPANIRLIRDGRPIHNANGKSLRFPIDQAGVYRVEVYYKGQPWIFSNPIFLREA